MSPNYLQSLKVQTKIFKMTDKKKVKSKFYNLIALLNLKNKIK